VPLAPGPRTKNASLCLLLLARLDRGLRSRLNSTPVRCVEFKKGGDRVLGEALGLDPGSEMDDWGQKYDIRIEFGVDRI
jgi:hypothetical protein